MTRQDIFVQILTEVSGKSEKELLELVGVLRRKDPGSKLDEEIPHDEAEKLLSDLRGEAPGILSWLEAGSLRVAERGSGTEQ